MAGTPIERPQKPVAESNDYLRLAVAKRENDGQKASEALQSIEERRKANV